MSASKSKYIVRQPIKDTQNKVLGYEILYYGDNQAFGGDAPGAANDFQAADTIYHFLTENTDKVLRESLNFMTFTTTLLMKKTPRLFDKSELVIQIDDSVIIHPLAMRMVHQCASEGYKIAVNEFRFAPRYLGQLDTIDYIKINFKTTNDVSVRNIVEIAHSLDKKCIATEIASQELYDRAISMGVDALQGSYVADQLTTKAHSSSYLQSNFFRLMVAVTRDEPDVEEIEELIAMDVTLTYALLKMANSIYFALQRRATTIHQAVMTLGLNQLKQWVYLLGASNGEEGNQSENEEFLKRSFLRANFCSELMRYAQNMPISKSDAYLMGMFSTLNSLIDAPLEEILSQIPIVEEVKAALLRREGRCGLLFELVLSYERADWSAISVQAESLGIPASILTNVYFNCVESVNAIWKQLTNPNPLQKEEQAEATAPKSASVSAPAPTKRPVKKPAKKPEPAPMPVSEPAPASAPVPTPAPVLEPERMPEPEPAPTPAVDPFFAEPVLAQDPFFTAPIPAVQDPFFAEPAAAESDPFFSQPDPFFAEPAKEDPWFSQADEPQSADGGEDIPSDFIF